MTGKDTNQGRRFELSVRHASLALLTLSTSALILTMRYSRTMPGPIYITSTAVVFSETLKLTTSVLAYCYCKYYRPLRDHKLLDESGRHSFATTRAVHPSVGEIASDLFGRQSNFSRLLLTSILYTITNNLQYVAVSNLDAASCQITYQSKLIITAVFTFVFLGKKLSLLKCFSIVLLASGVALVSLSTPRNPALKDYSTFESQRWPQGDRRTGLIAVTTAVALSGLAGVYFEYTLKKRKQPSTAGQIESWPGKTLSWPSTLELGVPFQVIFHRNSQLAFSGVMLATMCAFICNGHEIRENGFFHGYNRVTYTIVFLQAFTGTVVSIVIASADGIQKGFATSMSVILSTAISAWNGDVVLTWKILLGAACVLVATQIYGSSCTTKPEG